MPTPPLPSPGQPYQSDQEHEPTTGEYLAAKAEDVVRDRLRGAGQKTFLSGFVGFVGSIVGAIGIAFAAYTFIVTEARAQTDAGMKVVAQQAANTQAQLESYRKENDARFQRLEHQGDRNETKLDAMLQAFRVPNPAPKPPDGGPP